MPLIVWEAKCPSTVMLALLGPSGLHPVRAYGTVAGDVSERKRE